MEGFVREALARAEEVGNPRALSLCHNALGAVQYLRGDWPESFAALEKSVALARSFGGTFGEVIGEQRIALIETGLGRYDAACDRLCRALATARASDSPMVQGHSIGRILATLARNRLESGDLTHATEYLAEGFTTQEAVGECSSCDVLLYPAAVPIYIALGDLERAEWACRKAEETATAFGSRAWIATARYLRGVLAGGQGDWSGAADHLQAAVEMFDGLGQPYDAARSLQALADVATRAGAALPDLAAEKLAERAATLYGSLHAGSAREGPRKPRGRAVP